MDPTLVAELKEHMGRIPSCEKAILQLEKDHKALVMDISQKMNAVRGMTYGERGSYRGVFHNEDQARAFGLYTVARVAHKQWAMEALQSDHGDTFRAFTSSDADALIPEQSMNTILDLIETYGVFERNARRFPMSSDLTRYPKKTARMIAVPLAEATAATADKPTIIKKTLTANKWGVYTEIPTEVMEDSIVVIAEMIARDIAQGFALAIDQAGFIGDGTGTYSGITGVLNALIAEAIVTSAGNSWSLLALEDFEQVVSLPVTSTFSGQDAKWYCSHQFFWQVMVKRTLDVGGVTAGEVEGVRRPLFLGHPVEFTQVMPTASAVNQTACVFGNLRLGATFGDRRTLTIKDSEHYKLGEDLIAVLGTRRFDIQIDGAGNGTTVEVLSALKTAAV